jgi:uncharacterized protein YbjT (DUF2867 family)
MTTAVIGATGRVGSEIVRGVLARGDAVSALVRDPGKARRAFGEPSGLHIRPTRLDDPRDLTGALDGIRTVFIAMGSVGIEGVLQRIAISAAAGISSIEQVTRLSVLNASADSLGINQRAHDSIDQFAASTAVPYSTIPPAIFSASLLAAILAGENDYTTGTFGQITGPPAPGGRVPSPVPYGIHLMPVRHPQPPCSGRPAGLIVITGPLADPISHPPQLSPF